MSFLYLAGEQANVLGTALAVTSTSADALFPLADLYAGRPSRMFRFDANAADLIITANTTRIINGGFEIGALDGWTEVITGTGSTSKELVIFQAGAASLECDAGAAGTAERYQDIAVRAGERMEFNAYLYGGGIAPGNPAARVRMENLHTGNYLDSAGDWGAADDVATQAAAAWAQTQLAFQVESLSDCGGQPLVTLRLHMQSDAAAAGGVYFDEVKLYSAVNFASIHGHNLAPAVVPELRSSTDAFGGVDTLEATFTIGRPSFYAYLATAVYRDGWQLKLSGTNHAVPYQGEMWLGYAESIAEAPRHGLTFEHEYLQVRQDTAARETYVHGLSEDAPRRLKLSFRQRSDARWEELRDKLWRRSHGGAAPLVIVPDSDRADVLHGRPVARLDVTRGVVTHDDSLTIVEDGFPPVGL